MSPIDTRSLLSALLLAATLLLTACAGAAYPREAAAPGEPARCEDDAAACERELRARQLELSQALPAPGEPQATGAEEPDCDAARGLRDRICELADAICALAERNAGNADLAAKCSNAQSSCTQARADVTAGCGS